MKRCTIPFIKTVLNAVAKAQQKATRTGDYYRFHRLVEWMDSRYSYQVRH